ncbi:MAG: ATP-binding protein [Actinomycetota bacterium]
MAPPTNDVITVSVPAEAASVQVLRAVTASVAARSDMSFDGIEDLRLAVDEACAWLLTPGRQAGSMTLRLRPMDDRLEAVVSIDGAGPTWPPPDAEQSLSWRVLSALVDTLSLEGDDAGPAIHLTKRTLEPSRTA